MINPWFQLIFLFLTGYLMFRCRSLYLRDPDRPDARYLLGWSVCTFLAVALGVIEEWILTGEAGFDRNVSGVSFFNLFERLGIPPIGLALYHTAITVMALGMIYYGVGFGAVLSDENMRQVRRCKKVLSLVFLAMTAADFLFVLADRPIFADVYGGIYAMTGWIYTALIAWWYHLHAKGASPVTKWRMRISESGCLLCLLYPVTLAMPAKEWMVRPNDLLVVIAWGLFNLSMLIPAGLKRRIVALEMAPKLLNDALFMWQYITARYHLVGTLRPLSLEKPEARPDNVLARIPWAFKCTPQLLNDAVFLLGAVTDCYNHLISVDIEFLQQWMTQWSSIFHLSSEQTVALTRAAYLNLGWLFARMEKEPIPITEKGQKVISEEIVMDDLSERYAHEIYGWQDVAFVLRHTTERWDGRGEPKKLKGELIPIESRILAIVEAFVTKQHDTNDTDAAIAYIRAGAGTRFDPRMVTALEDWVQESWR